MEFYNKVQSQQTEVDQGELKVSVFTEDGTRPIENALVRISFTGGVGNRDYRNNCVFDFGCCCNRRYVSFVQIRL